MPEGKVVSKIKNSSSNNSKKYNTLLYKSDNPNADYSEDEHLMDYPIRYKYILFIY